MEVAQEKQLHRSICSQSNKFNWFFMSKNHFFIRSIFSGMVFSIFALPAHAFDGVSNYNSFGAKPIKSLVSRENGIFITYADGKSLLMKNNGNPLNGSPFNYKYVSYDAQLGAYLVEVWRVGRQNVLINKKTGRAVEIGANMIASLDKKIIFSTECKETSCYYKLNEWPSGKQLFYSEKTSKFSSDAAYYLYFPIDTASIKFVSEFQINFEMPCTTQSKDPEPAKAALYKTKGKWNLSSDSICDE